MQMSMEATDNTEKKAESQDGKYLSSCFMAWKKATCQ